MSDDKQTKQPAGNNPATAQEKAEAKEEVNNENKNQVSEAKAETKPAEAKTQEAHDKAPKAQAEDSVKEGGEKAELRPGFTVRVHQKIKEGEKERIQVFEGIILGIRGKNDVERTMTVRKVSHGVGVEKIFPVASPTIEKIEVVKKAKVRRAKLYFLRNYTKRLREVFVK